MVITLLSLLCNLSYRMHSLPSFLNGGGANKFLNKTKRWGVNNCCNAGGVLGQMSFNFFRNTIFPEKIDFNKK